jgi:hypothetical protein
MEVQAVVLVVLTALVASEPLVKEMQVEILQQGLVLYLVQAVGAAAVLEAMELLQALRYLQEAVADQVQLY